MLDYFLSLLGRFRRLARAVPDTRVAGRSTYTMEQILTIVYLAFCANAGTWKEIHRWAANNFSRILEEFPDLKRCPSEGALARVTCLVEEETMNWMRLELGDDFLKRSMPKRGPGRPKKADTPRGLAAGGKTSRGAKALARRRPRPASSTPSPMASPWPCGGRSTNPTRSRASPWCHGDLRRRRQLKGTVVASDAMSCQKAIVDKTIGYGAGYLISLKGNQSGFHDQAVGLLERGEDMYPGKIAKQSFKKVLPPDSTML